MADGDDDSITWVVTVPYDTEKRWHVGVLDTNISDRVVSRRMVIAEPGGDEVDTAESEMKVWVGESGDNRLKTSYFAFDDVISGYLREMGEVFWKIRMSEPRALFLGLGGGVLASWLAMKLFFGGEGGRIDVVEISEAVVDAAKLCFGFRDRNDRCLLFGDVPKHEPNFLLHLPMEAAEMIHVFIEDACEFVKKVEDEVYDAVFIDLSSRGDKIRAPIESARSEAFVHCILRLLRKGGVAVFNVLVAEEDMRNKVVEEMCVFEEGVDIKYVSELCAILTFTKK